jgi:hypothetical protein
MLKSFDELSLSKLELLKMGKEVFHKSDGAGQTPKNRSMPDACRRWLVHGKDCRQELNAQERITALGNPFKKNHPQAW